MTYLYLQRNRFYYKRKIPNTNINIVLSLQTDSLAIAKNLLVIINSKALNLFKTIKESGFMDILKVKTLVNKYIQEAIQEYSELETLRHQELTYIEDGKKFAGHSTLAIVKAEEHIADVLMTEDEEQLKNEAEKILKRSNITELDLESLDENERRILNYELLKGETNVLIFDKRRNEARLNEAIDTPIDSSFQVFSDNGVSSKFINAISKHFGKDDAHSVLDVITNPQPKNRHYLKTIPELLEEFLEYKPVKEPHRYRRDVEIFMQIVGYDYLIDIEHSDFNRFLKDITFLPPQNKYKRLYAEKSIVEIISMSKTHEYEKLARQTVIDKIINVNAFIDFAVDNEYLDMNRLKSKTKHIKKSKKDIRKEYRLEQLHNLFHTSKWYTSDFEKYLKKFPSRIWIPLILLYNGFRINEIAQIYLDQIIMKEDVWMFRIAIDHPDQQLKNDASKRTIPIHPKLIELGFLDFYEYQRQKGYTRLFQELYFTNKKGYGQAFSKVFNNKKFKEEWLDEETLKRLEDKIIMLDLHSFRHTFSGRLKGIIEEDTREFFLGHSAGDTDYGNIQPKPAYDNIAKCEYDLDLTILSKKLHTFYEN